MSQSTELVEGLVSIVAPCYNVEEFLPDFLDSLIAQTYKNLELIIVNDGSTDGTLEVIFQYKQQLETEEYLVKVVDQENRGLGGAVNSGLALFTGEYLMWPDPDDWLTPNSIERRIELMKDHPDVGLLRSNCNTYIQSQKKDGDNFMPYTSGTRRVDGFFWDVVLRRTFLAPVSSMVRSSCFLDVYPGRQIYVNSKASQNIQILIPLVDAYPVLECGEVLGYYRVRDDSRSRRAKNVEQILARHRTIYEVMSETLKVLKQRRPELEALMVVHYGRNIFLPLLYQAGAFREAWGWMRRVKMPYLQSGICLVIMCLRRVFGSRKEFGKIVKLFDRMYSWIVKRGDLFADYAS